MRERESLGGCELVSWHVVGRDGNGTRAKVLWVYVVHPMWLFDFVVTCPSMTARKSANKDCAVGCKEQNLSIRYVKGMWTSHFANLSRITSRTM